MEKHLRATSFLDFDHPALLHLATRLQNEHQEPRQLAQAVFYFVRDQIYYNPYVSFEKPEDYRASLVLARGEGFCIPKAALCSALMRRLGFPARLHLADIRNHQAPAKIRKLMDNLFACHCYLEIFLDERWIKLAPTFNRELFAAIGVKPNDFDGSNDAMLPPFDLEGRPFVEYIKDRGLYDDIPFAAIMTTFREVYSPEILANWRSFRPAGPVTT
ncbi:MAG: transglutaminase family protein [Deltaproteobacteria bacterium]|nr:transglutaminase family protein [Deltaproteobacteria bacterium]